MHLYYRANDGDVFRGKLIDGIDIKWRGYVATAPSIHPSGARYTVIDDRDPIVVPNAIREQATK